MSRNTVPATNFRSVRLPLGLLAAGLLIALAGVACSGAGGLPATPTEAPSGTTPAATLTAFPLTVIPSGGTPSPTEAGVSFDRDVLPILQANCTRCHGDTMQSAGLNFSSYADLMAYAGYGMVVPGDASNSMLVEVIAYGMMPADGTRLTAQELHTIDQWIDAGAPNN